MWTKGAKQEVAGMFEELPGVWYYSSVKCEERLLGATVEGVGQRQLSIRALRSFSGGRRGQGQNYSVGRRQT